jgi:hypothetical protein
MARYDTIGQGYARYRREDPRLAARIRAALEAARSVVNVGAGCGSYEPSDLHVLAVEPSDVMASQRLPGRVPAIRATAAALPLRDASVDAAMAILPCITGTRTARRACASCVASLEGRSSS